MECLASNRLLDRGRRGNVGSAGRILLQFARQWYRIRRRWLRSRIRAGIKHLGEPPENDSDDGAKHRDQYHGGQEVKDYAEHALTSILSLRRILTTNLRRQEWGRGTQE